MNWLLESSIKTEENSSVLMSKIKLVAKISKIFVHISVYPCACIHSENVHALLDQTTNVFYFKNLNADKIFHSHLPLTICMHEECFLSPSSIFTSFVWVPNTVHVWCAENKSTPHRDVGKIKSYKTLESFSRYMHWCIVSCKYKINEPFLALSTTTIRKTRRKWRIFVIKNFEES